MTSWQQKDRVVLNANCYFIFWEVFCLRWSSWGCCVIFVSFSVSLPFSPIVLEYSGSALGSPNRSLVLIGSQKVCVPIADKEFSRFSLSLSLFLLSRCYRCSFSPFHCLHTFGFNYFGPLGNMLL